MSSLSSRYTLTIVTAKMATKVITVREYASLTLSEGYSSLDRHTIRRSAFDWLLEEQAKFFKNGQPILQIDGKHALKLGSYVGYLQSPCGTEIEILPKTSEKIPDTDDEIAQIRRSLCDMVYTYLGNKERSYEQADLQLFKKPVSEFIMARFLEELNLLIRKGLRHTYVRIEEESKYLRGQLRIAQQTRQPVSRAHFFQISHDIFTVNRSANRLIKSALEWVIKNTKTPNNWRLANELYHQTHEIPLSKNMKEDFKAWSTDRLMESYKAIRTWTELILYKQNPTTQRGNHTGIAMLFPMEYLFEDYVANRLRKQLPTGWSLKVQAKSEYLIEDHFGSRMFNLNPDLMLIGPEGRRIILDTKWKLIDENDRGKNYGISQADMYQMYAYGKKYLAGAGKLYLIYPSYEKFLTPLSIFKYDGDLDMNVVPFDIEKNRLVASELFEFPQNLN
ncbi:restriction endonuclease [Kordiimonas sediminis]|uniref:Restriction endonuclease n=1 Tax=Kordiimonas sediminis TaxID=1735581 RepID=A0A919AM61_9PROT|nr:McrC family protein [Kordiimonas sediminis]GHF12502.1 restriction endonuclease [Kordiimonas sediminis]